MLENCTEICASPPVAAESPDQVQNCHKQNEVGTRTKTGVEMNRRHKVGLLLTLIAVGLCLLLDASLKQTAGVFVLSVAASLLIGGLKARTLQIIGCLTVSALGLLIIGARLLSWRGTTKQAAHEYDNAILDLNDAIPYPAESCAANAPTSRIDISAGMVPKTPRLESNKGEFTNIRPIDPWAIVKTEPLPSARAGVPQVNPNTKYLVPKQGAHGQIDLSSGFVPKTQDSGRGTQPCVPSDLWNYLRKVVVLPESTKKWERRIPISGDRTTLPRDSREDQQSDDAGTFVLVTSVPFPEAESNTEVMRYFQAEILRPRPVISLRVALRAELLSILLGLALFATGMLGCIRLVSAIHPKGRPADAA